MTAYKLVVDSSSAKSNNFVLRDAAELASHMSHCASSRSRFFALQSALQSAHAVLLPRIVTVAALGAIGLALFAFA